MAEPRVESEQCNKGEVGKTPREVAAYLRVGKDTILGWIRSGKMAAVNTAKNLCGKPQYVVLPHHLADYERSRLVTPPPKTKPRKRTPKDFIDFLPD